MQLAFDSPSSMISIPEEEELVGGFYRSKNSGGIVEMDDRVPDLRITRNESDESVSSSKESKSDDGARQASDSLTTSTSPSGSMCHMDFEMRVIVPSSTAPARVRRPSGFLANAISTSSPNLG